jgi:hypothetical protein
MGLMINPTYLLADYQKKATSPVVTNPLTEIVRTTDTKLKWVMPAYSELFTHVLIGPTLKLQNFQSGIWRLGQVYGQPETRVIVRVKVPEKLADTITERNFKTVLAKFRVNLTSPDAGDTIILQGYSLNGKINFKNTDWKSITGTQTKKNPLIKKKFDQIVLNKQDRWATLNLTDLHEKNVETYRILLTLKRAPSDAYLTINSMTTFHYYDRPRLIWTK